MLRKAKDAVVHFIKGTDKLLLILCLLASAFGVLCVYSATRYTISDKISFPRDARTMIVAICLGLFLAAVISLIDYDIICKLWPVFAVGSVALMILVMLVGVGPPSRPDSRVWLNLRVFYFQPSELVKIFFIITFSTHLDAVKNNINKLGTLALLILHALVPTLLVMKSGDDGSAVVFMGIAAIMLFVAGISWKYILAALALIITAVPLLWFKFMSEFQKQRFIVIVNPEAYPDTAYQQNMGLSAIGQGGFLGTGLFKGAYTQSHSVPESSNDFIFTVIAEEFGTLGCIITLGLILAIIFRIIHNGKKSIFNTSTLMCYGIASMIAIQVIINVAMCLRLGPVVGITLPFFSSGGSSSLCLYIGLGLIFSVYRTTYNQKPTNFRLTSIRSPYVSQL